MVQETDAAVAHPDTVVINTKNTFAARGAVLRPWGHNQLTVLAKGKSANFRHHVRQIPSPFSRRRRLQLKKFRLIFVGVV